METFNRYLALASSDESPLDPPCRADFLPAKHLCFLISAVQQISTERRQGLCWSLAFSDIGWAEQVRSLWRYHCFPISQQCLMIVLAEPGNTNLTMTLGWKIFELSTLTIKNTLRLLCEVFILMNLWLEVAFSIKWKMKLASSLKMYEEGAKFINYAFLCSSRKISGEIPNDISSDVLCFAHRMLVCFIFSGTRLQILLINGFYEHPCFLREKSKKWFMPVFELFEIDET